MPEFFGLDIGSHSIKAVQVRRDDRGGVRLTHFSTYSTPSDAYGSQAEKHKKKLAEAVKNTMEEAGIKSSQVVASLPESKIFTRVIEMPKMSEKELKSSLEYEAERYIPFPVESAVFDSEIVSKGENSKKMQVLLVAAPESLVTRYLDILEGAGLEILALEPETVSLVRALVGRGEKAAVPTLLVSIGSSTTDLVITENGKIGFTRSVATGGKALGRALARALSFEEEQAESYKRS
ncbi:MAG: type IV pilus assembly protein PilM, partial [Patescibacteria group bacterium]|nr:type IV pilus assembly protein PilM [Patescibacteria group bacterium]